MPKFKLCDICEFITDGTHQTPKYCESGGYIFLSSKDVTSHRIDWANTKRIPSSLHEKLYSRLAPRKNDVLLAKNGTTGVAAIVDRDEIFDVYVSLAVLRPKAEILPEYLLYAINSPICKRQFDAGLKGVGVPNLHLNVIRETEISVPSYSQQIEICKKLRMVLNIIEQRNNQLKKMEDLIKARFVEMFGDPEAGTCIYEIEKLGNLCVKISDGVHAKPIYTETGRPFLSVVNINKGVVDFTDCKYVSEEAYQKMIKSTHPEKGDVLYTKVGATYGIPAYVDTEKEFCLYVSVCLIKPEHERINSRFLSIQMAMPAIKHQADSRIKGIGVPDLHLNQISEFHIIVPPRELQDSFVEFATQVDKSKVVVQATLDKQQLLFDSLMQVYFG